jgi:polysaccharide export outer membrane protein
MNKIVIVAAVFSGLSSLCISQERVKPNVVRMKTPYATNSITQSGTQGTSSMAPGVASVSNEKATGSSVVSSAYVLGPGDLLTLSVGELEDSFQDKTFRIDTGGDVNFPSAGRIHAAGLTIPALEREVNNNLKRILKDPDAVIGISEFHSQPVSVLGSVNLPGMHQLEGQRNLFAVLSLAGGLTSDAGYSIVLTRNLKWGTIPLPNTKLDPTGQFSIASVKVKSVMNGSDPTQNITIMPDDVISIPKAEVVYAVGAVTLPGGFLIGENGTLSTLQVLALAQGLGKTSSPARAEILRVSSTPSGRLEIPVNIKNLLAGKATDISLQADDILFVPTSTAKAIAYRSIEAIVSTTSGMATYGRY